MHICSVHLLANKFWQHIIYSACVTCVGVAVVPNSIANTSKILTPIEFWARDCFHSFFCFFFRVHLTFFLFTFTNIFHCCAHISYHKIQFKRPREWKNEHSSKAHRKFIYGIICFNGEWNVWHISIFGLFKQFHWKWKSLQNTTTGNTKSQLLLTQLKKFRSIFVSLNCAIWQQSPSDNATNRATFCGWIVFESIRNDIRLKQCIALKSPVAKSARAYKATKNQSIVRKIVIVLSQKQKFYTKIVWRFLIRSEKAHVCFMVDCFFSSVVGFHACEIVLCSIIVRQLTNNALNMSRVSNEFVNFQHEKKRKDFLSFSWRFVRLCYIFFVAVVVIRLFGVSSLAGNP